MKYILLFLISFTAIGQTQMPNVTLKNLDNTSLNVKNDFSETDKIYVFSFWATWCAPCINELEAINEVYEDWKEEINVEVIAVSVDDTKTINSVPIYVNGMGWEYLVIMDPNGDFKRAMGVNNEPHTFILDKDGNIIYSHNNYAPGDEDEIYDILLKLNASE